MFKIDGMTYNFAPFLTAVTCEDPNSIYAPSSTGCPATCENPNAPEDCLLPDVYDACVCPIGFLLFQDLCILPADCGCVQNNSAYLVRFIN